MARKMKNPGWNPARPRSGREMIGICQERVVSLQARAVVDRKNRDASNINTQLWEHILRHCRRGLKS
eukprot:11191255-Lingulodinium_polyedra.AAC.1